MSGQNRSVGDSNPPKLILCMYILWVYTRATARLFSTTILVMSHHCHKSSFLWAIIVTSHHCHKSSFSWAIIVTSHHCHKPSLSWAIIVMNHHCHKSSFSWAIIVTSHLFHEPSLSQAIIVTSCHWHNLSLQDMDRWPYIIWRRLITYKIINPAFVFQDFSDQYMSLSAKPSRYQVSIYASHRVAPACWPVTYSSTSPSPPGGATDITRP